ncbi:MAG: hypothetical protein K9N10_22545 [Deltaproteobacteria bacterium]|nr:hypothetical protein [Deltaproteobacteria bacterium]
MTRQCKQASVLLAVFFMTAGASPALGESPSLPEGLNPEASETSVNDKGPSLPQGLEGKSQRSSEPNLPSGLAEESTPTGASPSLPSGLEQKKTVSSKEKKSEQEEESPWRLPGNLGGYWEMRGGVRIYDDPVEDQVSLAETRLQLSYDQYLARYLPRGQFRITSDFILDAVSEDWDTVDLEDGVGLIDLRELWLSFTPLDFLDAKIGRQILTWGTGNLIFLNDLFPKDYQAFFLGRNVDYLKAPSDSVKASFYSDVVNLDMVYNPRFDPDRYVNGSRLSFYDPATGTIRGENDPLMVDRPDQWFKDDELAARLYRNLDAYELAAYGYTGYWKEPAGVNPVTGVNTFPPLTVLGASIRGPAGPGIGNGEFSWYDSRDDANGDDPYIRNSQLRFLLGYEQEVAEDLTLGLQYYLNYMLDYRNYQRSLPPGTFARDEARHWVTLDITQELLAQNQLILSLFIFYSLSENDVYLRPKATYDFTDNWKVEIGGNIFTGKQEAFFGQFEENSNVYAAIRYSF